MVPAALIDTLRENVTSAVDELVKWRLPRGYKKKEGATSYDGKVRCKGLGKYNQTMNNCVCLQGFNSYNGTEFRLFLIENLVQWMMARFFVKSQNRAKADKKEVAVLKRSVEDSLFAILVEKNYMAVVMLNTPHGRRTLCSIEEYVTGTFLCLPSFLHVFEKIEEQMEWEYTLSGLQFNTEIAKKNLRVLGCDRIQKRIMRSLFLAYAIQQTVHWKNQYEIGRLPVWDHSQVKKMANPTLDWNRVRLLAKQIAVGASLGSGALEGITNGEEGKAKDFDKIDSFLGTEKGGATIRQRLANYGLHNGESIIVLAPGSPFCEQFLVGGFDNGKGTNAKDPRVRLFQISSGALDCFQELFDNCVRNLPDKQWASAKWAGNSIKYVATEGGIYNGLKTEETTNLSSNNKIIVKPGTELEVIALDKYINDLLSVTMEGDCKRDGHVGCEKAGSIENRWIAAKEWAVEKDESFKKSGGTTFDWWHAERDQLKVWIDLGFLYSSKHFLQKPHYDYSSLKAMLENWQAFFGLTASGMFLQIWPTRPKIKRDRKRKRLSRKNDSIPVEEKVEGRLVFIPRGIGLVVGGETCHGGGLLCEPSKEYESKGHPRAHCYVRERQQEESKPSGSPNRKRTRSSVHSGGVSIGTDKSNQYQEYDSEDPNLSKRDFTNVSADSYRFNSIASTEGRIVGSKRNKGLDSLLFG